jgi:methylmalonyl-CoA/ethylmalonyl-CoA epimerase
MKIPTHASSNLSFMGAKFHHVGIACKNIELTFHDVQLFLPSKYEHTDVVYDKTIEASLQLISIGNQAHIELVSGKIVENFLKKDIRLYHTCFEVFNIEAFSAALKNKGYTPLTKFTPAQLFGGRLIQFFVTPLGLIEILEAEK